MESGRLRDIRITTNGWACQLSGSYESCSPSVLRWATTWGFVSRPGHRTHFECSERVWGGGEGQRLPQGVVPSPVGPATTTQRSFWSVTHRDALQWSISQRGGAIITLSPAKPLTDLYLTRLSVWCMDTWGGFKEQCRGLATRASEETNNYYSSLTSCPKVTGVWHWPPTPFLTVVGFKEQAHLVSGRR